MAETHRTKAAAAATPGLGAEDLTFVVLLVMALLGVVLSGRIAYQQGARLEAAKANAQLFVRWAEAAVSGADKEEGFALRRCTSVSTQDTADVGTAMALAKPASWAMCRQALQAEGAPLSTLSNPFDALNPLIGGKCERKLPASRGLVVVEKGTPAPPGLPPGVAWSPLADEEVLVRGLMLRVLVCDGGGYPIRIAEVSL